MCPTLKVGVVADTETVTSAPERSSGMAMACEGSGLGSDLGYYTHFSAYFLA